MSGLRLASIKRQLIIRVTVPRPPQRLVQLTFYALTRLLRQRTTQLTWSHF